MIVDYIKSDLFRYTGSVTLRSFLSQLIKNRSFKYSFWLRLTNAKSFFVKKLANKVHSFLSDKYAINIPTSTKIGYGLYIGHHMCIVINGTTQIGNNCNIGQFLTIGSNNESAAIIGDNVYIGPNVCIVEDVHIGSNCTIGAGAVIVKDIPKNSTAAGNPAKVISQKNHDRFIQNKWVCP